MRTFTNGFGGAAVHADDHDPRPVVRAVGPDGMPRDFAVSSIARGQVGNVFMIGRECNRVTGVIFGREEEVVGRSYKLTGAYPPAV